MRIAPDFILVKFNKPTALTFDQSIAKRPDLSLLLLQEPQARPDNFACGPVIHDEDRKRRGDRSCSSRHALPLDKFDQPVRLPGILIDHPKKCANNKIRLRACLFEIAQTGQS
jgi:hypothetical protein